MDTLKSCCRSVGLVLGIALALALGLDLVLGLELQLGVVLPLVLGLGLALGLDLAERAPLVQQSQDEIFGSNPTEPTPPQSTSNQLQEQLQNPSQHTPQPIIHTASTSKQQPTSELPQKEASRPQSTSIKPQEQLQNPSQHTPQPIIHTASTSKQQPTSELPQKEPTPPQSTSIQPQEQLQNPSYDPELLITNRVSIVKSLNMYVVAFMLPFLEWYDKEVIHKQETPSEKYGTLLDILQRLATTGGGEIFNKFMQYVAAVLPELFNEIVARQPTPSETDSYVNDTKRELMEDIKKVGHNVHVGSVDDKIDLVGQHVELAMVAESLEKRLEERAGTDGQLPDSYQEHTAAVQRKAANISPLYILDNGPESGEAESQPQKILIYGRAGIGKSTLLQWLAYQWACLEWAPKFSLIFSIQLRTLSLIHDQITAIELLTLYGLYSLTDSGLVVASSLLENLFTKVIIIVDGLDEISQFHQHINSDRKVKSVTEKAYPLEIVLSILRGDILRGCTVIVASRPFTDLNKLSVTRTFEILGLTEDRLQAFVEGKHGKSAAKGIMSVLNKNEMLKSICTITFYGMMVSQLLKTGAVFAEDDLKSYTRLTAYISMEFLSRRYKDLLREMGERFNKLAKMAYSGIFQIENNMSRIVFNESDLRNYQISTDDVNFLVKCGIIHTYSGKKSHSVIVEFIHLSVQEFLAAAHLVSSPTVPDRILDSLFSSGQFDMTLLFTLGFLYDTKHTSINCMYKAVNLQSGNVQESVKAKLTKALIDELSNTSHDGDSRTKLKHCQIVHETQSESLARQVADYVVRSKGELWIGNIHMTMLDLTSLAFVCKFSQALVRIRLWNVGADDHFVKLFVTTIFDGHKDSIKRLNLHNNNIGDEGVTTVCEVVRQSHCIEHLDLRFNHFTDVGRQMLAELKRQKPRLILYYKDDDWIN